MSCCCNQNLPSEPRRGFLAKMIAFFGGAFAVLTPIGAGIASYLNPLRQKPTVGDFVKVATLDSITETPVKITIRGDKTDAWTKEFDVPIGSIYLRKREDGSLQALQTLCPHAGCVIAFETVEQEDGTKLPQYYCPCHMALFDIEGKQLPDSKESPRDMDELETPEIRNGNEVWVKYQIFQEGTSEKKAWG